MMALQVVVLILAVWRLALLLTYEKSMQWLRDVLHTYELNEYGRPRRFLASIINCFWCNSLWLAALLWPVAFSKFWTWLLPFAVSGAAVLLLHWSGTLRYTEG